MTLADDLRAVLTSGGRRAVLVVCPEMAHAASGPALVVVSVPGARVLRGDGEVARAVALAAGSLGGAAEVVVAGHEGCAYRSPTFSVPGPAPQGESFPTVRDLVRHSVAQLAASPWMRGATLHGAVVGPAGTIERVGDVTPASPSAAASGAYAPAAGGSLSPSGPVSFFGGAGVEAGPSLAGMLPSAPGPARWESPPPIAPGGVRWESPAPMAPSGVGPLVPQGTPMGQYAMPAQQGMPTQRGMPTQPGMPLQPGMPTPLGMPSAPQAMPTVGPMPTVSAPMPTIGEPPAPPPPPTQYPAPRGSVGSLEVELAPSIDVSRPPPPPPPRPAPQQRQAPKPAASPPSPPAKPTADDPFARAEEILERLRRERRR